MSFKAEVIADATGNYYSNELRFETREEAELYAADLAARWLMVRDRRVTESDDPVNYDFVNGRPIARRETA